MLALRRRKSDRVFAGVAGGMADELGVSDAYVRAAFITLAAVWGLGLFLYVGLWLATFDRVDDSKRDPVDNNRAFGLSLAFVGAMILLATAGFWPNAAVVLTTAALAFGTAFLTDSSRPGPFTALLDPDAGQPSRIRVVIGVVLLVGGLAVFTSAVGQIFDIGIVFLSVALTGLGLIVAFGPWVRRLINDLGEERNERVRQEERAEMAAHLHDSVLQTLALIQRSDDPARMAILARHQEAELRDWLFGRAPLEGIDMVSTALKRAVSRVEGDFGIPVDFVNVGDVPLTDQTAALVGAASEAVINSAKHSGADRLSLFLEVDEQEAVLYVTDQGKGFARQDVPEDRRGIADSIVSRVEKAGGSVVIDSEVGEGTEVVMRMPL